jgi:hypothetical protein
MLSLVLIFGSVFSSVSSFPHPNNVFAYDKMGDSSGGGGGSDSDSDSGGNGGEDSGDGGGSNNNDDSTDMPKDAPLTADALTAGGSDNDDDDDGNEDDNNNRPTTEDAPRTADTVTTNKPECQKGQEYYLFSSGCQPTSAAAVCPSSYSSTEDFSITRGILNRNYEIKTDVLETRQFLIYQVADGDSTAGTDTDDFGTFSKQTTGASSSDPCLSEGDGQVSETRERLGDGGFRTTSTKQDGTSVVTILNLNGVRDPEGKLVPGAVEQDTKYNAQNKPTRTDSYDRSQNVVSTTAYDAKSGNPIYTQTFAANGDLKGTAAYSYNAQNKLTQVFHLDPQNNLLDRTVNTYTPNNLPRTSTTYDSNNQPTSKTVYAGGNTPLSETYYVDGKPVSVTRYDESGKTIGTFGPDGKPLGSSPATSTTTTTPPATQ